MRAAGFRALMVALLMPASPCAASAESALAIERIKAAFLYKFAAYVEWPARADPEGPIVIGIEGADTVARELSLAIAGRTVGARAMQVRRLTQGEQPNDCCQILFIGAASEPARVLALLEACRGRPVLTVTEAADHHPKGSAINFLGGEVRVRFDISLEAAEANGLQLRSQLLAVARSVI